MSDLPASDKHAKKKISTTVWIILACILFIAVAATGAFDNQSTSSKSSPEAQTAQKSESAFSADSVAGYLARINGIEQRVKDNLESMKTHYASKGAFAQGTIDLHDLSRFSLLRPSIGACKTDGERRVMNAAKKLYVPADNQLRQIYASSREEGFMSDGLNIRVSAIGKNNTTLRISYALMSQPMVYKFQNQVNLPETASALGFTKILYTNGFQGFMNDTWTIELSSQ